MSIFSGQFGDTRQIQTLIGPQIPSINPGTVSGYPPGRGTVLRKGRGRTRMTSWTHPSSTTSTKPTLIALLPGDAAVRAVDPGHQETPVGEGVMSRNNLHHQLNQPPTPAHNHQSTNHEHLQSLTTTIHKLTHLSEWSQGCMAH